MFLEIDLSSDIPIYVQIKNQIIEGIAKGELTDGDSLPSIRQLAEEIGVNMHTINKSYNQLKDLGLISINKKLGAYITINKYYNDEFIKNIKEEIKPIIAMAAVKGIEKQKFLEIVDEIYKEFGGEYNE